MSRVRKISHLVPNTLITRLEECEKEVTRWVLEEPYYSEDGLRETLGGLRQATEALRELKNEHNENRLKKRKEGYDS